MNIETDVLSVLIKAIIAFIVLLLATRLLGKKQMGQLTLFNYIAGITIGSIASNIAISKTGDFIAQITNLVTWTVLTLLLDLLVIKFPRLRLLVSGDPVILIKNGNIIKKAMKHNRISLDSLTMLLREEGVFSIRNVEFAVLESNGELTVYHKEELHNIARKDIKLHSPKPKCLPGEIVVDGKVVKRNLKEWGLSLKWLYAELKKQNIESLSDIFYAEIQTDGTLYIDHKKEKN
ncbi:YetF domain-containing protein [Haloplasma contractile]|uniref:Transmembrane protein YdfS n=1 Tax=Haloplasma contractile SSD-17B TaxID=1033810 RepID=U2EEA2_9MOLU|nr:DUF421 domain-containing protein [Haloplasma contractile]ERJ13016.1 transmembrane protein YdfS [Haloplasma contractile SSD-17B]